MKAVVLKSYDMSYQGYDQYEEFIEVWHGLRAVEEVLEVTVEEMSELRKAVDFHNSQAGMRDYKLKVLEVVEKFDTISLLSAFREHERVERELAEAKAQKKREEDERKRAKRELKRQEEQRAAEALRVSQLAAELGISEDEVKVILARRN